MQSCPPPPPPPPPPPSPPPAPRHRILTRLPLAGRGAVSDLALGLPLLDGRSAVGTAYVGTVYSVVRYGVFLRVGNGLDGLLHVRFMMGGLDHHIQPEDHYRRGDVVRVVTIGAKNGHLSFGLPLDEGAGDEAAVGGSERDRGGEHGGGHDDERERSWERAHGCDRRYGGSREEGRSPDGHRHRHRDSCHGYPKRDDGDPGVSPNRERGRHSGRHSDRDRHPVSHSGDRGTLREREREQWRERDGRPGGGVTDHDADHRHRRRYDEDTRRVTATEPDGWGGRKRPTTDRNGDGDARRGGWGDSRPPHDAVVPRPPLPLPLPPPRRAGERARVAGVNAVLERREYE